MYHEQMERTVHLLISESMLDIVAYTVSKVLPDSFEQCGANVITHDQLTSVSVGAEDRIVIVGGSSGLEQTIKSMFKPEHTWLFVLDEQRAGDPVPYERASTYAREALNTSNLVTTYENAVHMEWLENRGIRHVTMPHCVPDIRQYVAKKSDVLASGQFDVRPGFFIGAGSTKDYYVTRSDVAEALMHSDLVKRTTWLPHPGHSLSTLTHDAVYDRYMEILDEHRFAITCKAKEHDRMVGKYVEFGASHVLPIGDCPSYMPQAMKGAMVNVEGWSGPQIVAEVKRLLANPDEFEARTEAYVRCVKERYLGVPNAARVMREITNVG